MIPKELSPTEVIIDGKVIDCRTGYYKLEDIWMLKPDIKETRKTKNDVPEIQTKRPREAIQTKR